MSSAPPELPAIEDQTVFNLARWEEICANPDLAKLDFRIESDAYGHILITPPPDLLTRWEPPSLPPRCEA